jgi:hypothetical protein
LCGESKINDTKQALRYKAERRYELPDLFPARFQSTSVIEISTIESGGRCCEWKTFASAFDSQKLINI